MFVSKRAEKGNRGFGEMIICFVILFHIGLRSYLQYLQLKEWCFFRVTYDTFSNALTYHINLNFQITTYYLYQLSSRYNLSLCVPSIYFFQNLPNQLFLPNLIKENLNFISSITFFLHNISIYNSERTIFWFKIEFLSIE